MRRWTSDLVGLPVGASIGALACGGATGGARYWGIGTYWIGAWPPRSGGVGRFGGIVGRLGGVGGVVGWPGRCAGGSVCED